MILYFIANKQITQHKKKYNEKNEEFFIQKKYK